VRIGTAAAPPGSARKSRRRMGPISVILNPPGAVRSCGAWKLGEREQRGTSRLRGPSTCSAGCRESSIEPSLKEAAQT
jgi:hypothetical protein